MTKMLDGNTAALKAYEAEQDRLDREAPTRRELLNEAMEDMQDDSKMALFLEDEFLAGPLARIFRNLEGAIGELTQQRGMMGTKSISAIIQACALMERSVATLMVEDKENGL